MSEIPGVTDEGEDRQYRYGYSKCTPRWIQFCNNPKVVTAWLFWMSFVSSFVNHGITKINIPDIERRYDLSSSQSGLIPSSGHFSAALLVLPITIFGSHFHQPRILAISAFIMSMGSLLMALPQFTSGPYGYEDVIKDTCDVTGNVTLCGQTSSGLSVYLYVFILGQILQGVGATAVYSLGVVFIDSNVSAKDSPVYQAIVNLGLVFGPAVGYLAGSQLLTFYVEFYKNTVSGSRLSMDDPRWVGAWWLGYLISSALQLTVAIGIGAYPRKLPKPQSTREYSLSEKHQDETKVSSDEEQQTSTLRNVLGIMKATFCHPTLMLVVATMIFQDLIIGAISPFFTKFVQNQFQVTPSWAALVGGLATVVGAVNGMLGGGIIVRALNLKIKGMLVFVLIVSLTFPVTLLGFYLARCDNGPIAGVTVNYGNTSSSGVASDCNAQCRCTTAFYTPVCGGDNLQYFSPCHAGCQHFITVNEEKHYFNCSCVILPRNESMATPSATAGSCETDCNAMPIFLVSAVLSFFLIFGEHIPCQNIMLRSVPENQRAIVIGIQQALTRFLGGMPASVIFGAVLDSTCLQWQEKCGERGSCWIYDTAQVGFRTYLFAVALKLGSVITVILALYTYRPPQENQAENKSK